MTNFPEYKEYLERTLISNYTDDLKIFLCKMLRQIEYLRNLPENILIHIAFLMMPEHRLPGS